MIRTGTMVVTPAGDVGRVLAMELGPDRTGHDEPAMWCAVEIGQRGVTSPRKEWYPELELFPFLEMMETPMSRNIPHNTLRHIKHG